MPSKLISAVQYRDYILLFYDDGRIMKMVYDSFTDDFAFTVLGEYPRKF